MAWHILHTHSNQERRLKSYLDSKNIIALAPEIKKAKPLFPRYILACINLSNGDSRAMVRRALGLHSIVGFGNQYATVAASDVNLIMARIGPDGYVLQTDEAVRIARPEYGDPPQGTKGVINNDLYSDMPGVFDKRLRDIDRVKILFAATGLFSKGYAIVRPEEFEILPEEII